MAKITYVLDTSVYLHDADSINHFGRNDIVVPLKVLEEIDKHKQKQTMVGANARKIIRCFDTLRSKGDLTKGVRIKKGAGILIAKTIKEIDELPPDLDPSVPDHMIVGTALKVAKENEKRKVVLVSRDINLRVIGDSVGLKTQDYNPDKVVKDTSDLYTGVRELVVPQEDINSLYAGEEVILPEEKTKKVCPNEFYMLTSEINEKATVLARFVDHGEPLRHVIDYRKVNNGIWGVTPKNR